MLIILLLNFFAVAFVVLFAFFFVLLCRPRPPPGMGWGASRSPSCSWQNSGPRDPTDRLRPVGALSRRVGNLARDPKAQQLWMYPADLPSRHHSKRFSPCQGAR